MAGLLPKPAAWVPPPTPLYPVGTRVVCRYGAGTVAHAYPPPLRTPRARTWLLAVAADIGGLWFCDEIDLVPERKP